MILRSFASNQPFVLVALPVLVCAMVLPAAFSHPVAWMELPLPLETSFGPWLAYGWLRAVVVCLSVLLGAWLANNVFNRSEFFNTPTYVIALIYAVLGGVWSLHQGSLSLLLANVLILIGLDRQLRIFKQTRVLHLCFETGFWFGLAGLFFPPFLTLVIGAWVALLFSRAFSLREHLLLFVSAAIPFLYWFVYLYWNGRTDEFVLFRISASFNATGWKTAWAWPLINLAIVVALALLIGIPRYLTPADRAGNRTKMVKSTFLIMAIAQGAAIFIGFLAYHVWILPSLLVVCAILLGYWFANYRYSLLAPFVFYAILILSLLTAGAHYNWI
ncbi:MAG: hypothetical protein RLZZ262_1676 [Bacteroidota bacterium]